MTSSKRTYIWLREDLVQDAAALAQPRSDNLSDIIRAAIIARTAAALRGDVDGLPPQPRRSRAAERIPLAKVTYKAPAEEIERCDAVLEAAGSSRRAVAADALESYVAAGGDRLAAALPSFVAA